MEEVLPYTPSTNAVEGNSWINAPQLPHSNHNVSTISNPTTPTISQAPPVQQIVQPVASEQQVPSTLIRSSTEVANVPVPVTQASSPTKPQPTLAPTRSFTPPVLQQPSRFPSKVRGVSFPDPVNQWHASPTSSAIPNQQVQRLHHRHSQR